jgi:small subunit ribosomal protein S19
MARSIWKGPFYDISIFKKYSRILPEARRQPARQVAFGPAALRPSIWSRRSVIHPSFSGSIVEVYNGKAFVTILVTEEMVGHKFGRFVSTKKSPILSVSNKGGRLRKGK